MFSNDRPARDNLVDDLKKKIRDEKKILASRVVSDPGEVPEDEERPYRAKKLSEVFKAMGFEA